MQGELTFFSVVLFGSEAGGLIHMVFNAQQLFLCWVVILFWQRHKVGLKQGLRLLVEALYLSRVRACCPPSFATSNALGLHSVVPLNSEGYKVHLK
ncbi:hypothetical protein DPMN_132666 [Dreissena polymorpha]|uniref:Uncharacterized protein n=1 Tax=Dreissena polymorpha TaxID=45954 RepID=A0A9D4J938_DREPO|nr:hypothetical protein DPMN_132666 [Dreissena polymorpha]